MSLLGRILLLLILSSCASKVHENKKPQHIKQESWESATKTVAISSNENWWDLEQRLEIPSSILKRYNNALKPGQKLNIPARKYYIVKDGETAIKIANQHGLTFSELIYLNELEKPYELRTGQKLKVFEAKTKKTKPIHKASKLKLFWPIKGEIFEKFGQQENGKYNNELLLKTKGHIKASADGLIVYTGNEVGHYGNLIIIQHTGNWFSSYGNLKSILVNKGDMVTAGQNIAYVDKVPFYFGLRDGVEPVDPMKYLKKE